MKGVPVTVVKRSQDRFTDCFISDLEVFCSEIRQCAKDANIHLIAELLVAEQALLGKIIGNVNFFFLTQRLISKVKFYSATNVQFIC